MDTSNPIALLLLKALHTPQIIPSTSPRSERMIFRNMITNERNPILKMTLRDFITIISRKGRVIIGPKNFDHFLLLEMLHNSISLETISQDHLEELFEKTYPKNLLCNLEASLAASPLESTSAKPSAKQEKTIDPYELYLKRSAD